MLFVFTFWSRCCSYLRFECLFCIDSGDGARDGAMSGRGTIRFLLVCSVHCELKRECNDRCFCGVLMFLRRCFVIRLSADFMNRRVTESELSWCFLNIEQFCVLPIYFEFNTAFTVLRRKK